MLKTKRSPPIKSVAGASLRKSAKLA